MSEIEILKRSELFKDLSESELKQIAKFAKKSAYKANSVIFSENEKSHGVFILESGRVSIDIEVTGEKRLSVLTLSDVGSAVSWGALIEPFKHAASARAVVDSKILVVDAKELLSFLSGSPATGYSVMHAIAVLVTERLKNSRLQLINTRHGD